MEREEDDTAPSKNPLEVGQNHMEHSPVYFSPPSNDSSPWGSIHPLGSIETPVPVFPPDEYRDTRDNLPKVGHQLTAHSPAYYSAPSNASSPHSEERATWDSPRVPETPAPVLPLETYQDTGSDAESDIWQREFEDSLKLPTTTRGDVNTQPATTTSMPLSLKCRMCNASPTVDSRPTATMCGHIFCSGCVSRLPDIATAGLISH